MEHWDIGMAAVIPYASNRRTHNGWWGHFGHFLYEVFYFILVYTKVTQNSSVCFSFQMSSRANFATTYLYSKEVSGITSRNLDSRITYITPLEEYTHFWKTVYIYIQEGSYLCWPVHGSALHGDWCIASCQAHINFAYESICLLDDNVRNKVVAIHRCCTTAQAVSRWLPTAAAQVRDRVWSCRICGWQSGTGTGFLQVLWFPLPIFIPHCSIITIIYHLGLVQ
jgi:hypothetical protein